MTESRYCTVFLDGKTIEKITKLKKQNKIISRAGFIRMCINIILKRLEEIE